MELWRQCTHWLIQCRVLPPSHRVTWEGAQVCELAQALRDGVLLCQLLNNLLPHAINLREVNLRPQMSQVRARAGWWGARPGRVAQEEAEAVRGGPPAGWAWRGPWGATLCESRGTPQNNRSLGCPDGRESALM